MMSSSGEQRIGKASENAAQDAVICPVCRKSVKEMRPGSVTGWIFKDQRCTCTMRSKLGSLPRFGEEKQDEEQPGKFPDVSRRYKLERLIVRG